MLINENNEILKLCKQIGNHLTLYLHTRNKEINEDDLVNECIILQELIENFTIYFKGSKYSKYILVFFNFDGKEISIMDILNELSFILSKNIEKHFIIESFDSIISMIIQYQQTNGILKYKQELISTSNVRKTELQLQEQIKELKSNQQVVKNLISELNKHSSRFESRLEELSSYHQTMREKVEKTYIESQVRIQEADILFKNSKNITKFIDEYNMKSNDAMQNIKSISNEANKSLAQIKVLAAEADSNISGILDIKAEMENATMDIKKLKEDSVEITKKKEEIKKYEAQLTELLGQAVGGNLFRSFTARKMELTKPLQFWTTAMFVSFAAAAAWIYFIVLHGGNVDGIWWHNILGNTVKVSPAFLFIFYCVVQRNKERLFQEEYAFKASVALTIDAYSKLVGDQDERDRLISQAVQGIYRSPIKTTKLSQNDVNLAIRGIDGVKNTANRILKRVKKK